MPPQSNDSSTIEPLHFVISRHRTVERLLVHWTLLVAFSLLVYVTANNGFMVDAIIAGLFGALSACWLIPLTAMHLGDLRLAKSPVITIDSNGLWDRRLTAKPIPWTDILDIVGPVRFGQLVHVRLQQPNAHDGGANPLRCRMATWRARLGWSSHVIDVRTLDTDAAIVEAAMRRHRPDPPGVGIPPPPFRMPG